MSFEALKARQSEAWGSAPWEPMAPELGRVRGRDRRQRLTPLARLRQRLR
jgi:hypothetical protein